MKQPEPYGQELIMDLHECDVRFSRGLISGYFEELCELIDMQPCDLHFWDDTEVPDAECQTDPKTKGISAVQFILTSSIVIHTLEIPKSAYVNIFSCKPFNSDAAASFTREWFGAKSCERMTIPRI